MGKLIIGLLSGLIVFIGIGCTPKITPGALDIISIEGYDTTDYNIIFNDALRQKMLGNQADAVRLFSRALKINTWSDASYYQLSLLYQGAGDRANALKNAAKAAELDSENRWYVHNAGIQYYMLGRKDSAIYYFENLIRLEPEREDHQITLAGLYEENKEFEKAENIIRQFIDKYGEEEQLLVSLVRIYSMWGKNQQVEEMLVNLIEKSTDKVNAYGMLAEFYKNQSREEDAIEIYEKLFDIEPNDAQLQLSYLDFLRVSKKYDEFLAGINGIIINDSIEIDGKTGLFAGILTDNQLISEKADAMELPLMLFASNYQDSPDVILLVAQIFEACNKDDRFISTLRNYCERNPGEYFMWESLLFAYSSKERTSELYTTSKYVATKFNLSPIPKLMLAFAANERKEYDLALSELDKALMLAGNQEELLIEISSLLANVYYEKGDLDKAFQTYAKALDLSPDNALLLNNYAYYLSEQGIRLKEALSMITKCLTIESNSTYLDTYAWVLYKMKKYKRANAIMSELYDNNTMSSADHYEHYGYIKVALKDCDMAIRLWSEAKKIDNTKTHLDTEIAKCQEEK